MSNFTVSAKFVADAKPLVGEIKAADAALAGLKKSEDAAGDAARKLGADAGTAAAGLGRTGAAGAAAAPQLDRAGQSAGQTRQKFQALNYTINDVVASLSSGISPTTILMQQGPQLADAWGGVGPLLRSAGGAMMTAAGAAAGLVAAAALGVAAHESYAASIREVDIALAATGNRMGLTANEASTLAASIASASGISVRAAQDMTVGFARAGIVSSEALATAGAGVRDYAVATGQDLSVAMGDLAEKIAKPAKGIRDLADAYGIADAEQIKLIETMVAQGRQAEAQAAVAEIVNAAFDGMGAKVSWMTSLWNGLATAASGAWNAIGSIGADPTAAMKTAEEGKWRNELRVQEDLLSRATGRERAQREQEVQRLRRLLAGSDIERTIQSGLQTVLARESAARARGRQVSDLADRLNPDARRAEEEANQRSLIKSVLDDPSQTPFEKQRARLALEGLDRQLAEREQREGAAAQRIADKQIREAERAAKAQQREAEKAAREAEKIAREKATLAAEIAGQAAQLRDPYAAAIASAQEWRKKAYEVLGQSAEDHARYAGDIEMVFADLVASADRYATDYAAGLRRGLADLAAQSKDLASTAANGLKQMSSEGEAAFLRLLKSGKFSFDGILEAFLDTIAKMAWQRFVQPGFDAISGLALDFVAGLMGMGGSASQAWGSQGWGMFAGRGHVGRIAGSPGGDSGFAPASLWLDAPRYHGGGFGGLAPGEVPVIVKHGEPIYTPEQAANLGGMISALARQNALLMMGGAANDRGAAPGPQRIAVTLHDARKGEGRAEAGSDGQGGLTLDLFIEEVRGALADDLRRDTGTFTGALKGVFGLSRRVA
jgi:phage-related minor tail protein